MNADGVEVTNTEVVAEEPADEPMEEQKDE
jgi:hypothetical protein